MFGALLKNQMIMLNAGFFRKKQSGQKRSKSGTIGMIILYVFVFFALALAFVGTASSMADQLIPVGQDGLYYAMMGLLALLLGDFGSVFSTWSTLYAAKDNDMLLAMPIPPGMILLVRMVGVFLMSLLFTAVVWLPTMLVYWTRTSVSLTVIICPLVLLFINGVLVTVLSCVIGWLVAVIVSKVKNKTPVTVIFSLVFFGLYYAVFFKMNTFLQSILTYSESINTVMRSWIFPVYCLGLGAAGRLLPFFAFTGFTVVLFALCYVVLSKSFMKIAIGTRATVKTTAKAQKYKSNAIRQTLFNREMKRFTSSATYMLNAGLGIIIAPLLAVAALVKASDIRGLLDAAVSAEPWVMNFVPVIIPAMVCMIISMNGITAPSISLEGKTLWQIQSLPVPTREVLRAKKSLHMILNILPAVFTIVVLCIVCHVEAVMVFFSLVLCVIFIRFTAQLGLIANLKHPLLDWSNEVVPVKQSISVLLVILGGWLVCVAIGGFFILLKDMLTSLVYLSIWIVLLILVNALLDKWLYTKGVMIFESLPNTDH